MNETNTFPDRVFRFCPSCGAPGFAEAGDFQPGPRGKNRFCCEVCGFRYYINSSIGVAAIIVNDNNELLMTRRMKEPHMGTLDLPGGFADPGERAEDAVAREVKEEVCLEVADLKPWGHTYLNRYPYGGITYFTNDIIYTCRACDWSQLSVGDPLEVEAVLVPLDEVDPDQVGLESIRQVVTDLLEYGPDGPPAGR